MISPEHLDELSVLSEELKTISEIMEAAASEAETPDLIEGLESAVYSIYAQFIEASNLLDEIRKEAAS